MSNRSNAAPGTVVAISLVAGIVLAGWISKPPAVDYVTLAQAARVLAVAPAQAAPAPAPTAPVVAAVAPAPAPVKVAPAPAPARVKVKHKPRPTAPAARLVYVVPHFHSCTCGF